DLHGLRRRILEDRVGEGQVDRAAGRGGGNLEGSPQHDGDALRVMTLPGKLGELSVDVLLVEAGARAKNAVVIVDLVVQQPGGDHEGRVVAAGVVHLPGGLGRAGDDVQVDEGRLARHLVVPVRHGDHDTLVQAHDRHDVLVERQGVEEA